MTVMSVGSSGFCLDEDAWDVEGWESGGIDDDGFLLNGIFPFGRWFDGCPGFICCWFRGIFLAGVWGPRCTSGGIPPIWTMCFPCWTIWGLGEKFLSFLIPSGGPGCPIWAFCWSITLPLAFCGVPVWGGGPLDVPDIEWAGPFIWAFISCCCCCCGGCCDCWAWFWSTSALFFLERFLGFGGGFARWGRGACRGCCGCCGCCWCWDCWDGGRCCMLCIPCCCWFCIGGFCCIMGFCCCWVCCSIGGPLCIWGIDELTWAGGNSWWLEDRCCKVTFCSPPGGSSTRCSCILCATPEFWSGLALTSCICPFASLPGCTCISRNSVPLIIAWFPLIRIIPLSCITACVGNCIAWGACWCCSWIWFWCDGGPCCMFRFIGICCCLCCCWCIWGVLLPGAIGWRVLGCIGWACWGDDWNCCCCCCILICGEFCIWPRNAGGWCECIGWFEFMPCEFCCPWE